MSAQSTRRAGPYSVREVRDVAPEVWDGWVEGSPGGGHVLQSHAWGEFKRDRSWRPLRVVLENDSGEVVGTGQFLLYHTWPIPGRLMYCTKGPWLPWEDRWAVRAFFDGVGQIARRERVHTVKIEPEVPPERMDIKEHLQALGFRDARYDLNFSSTVFVDLSPSEEELLDKMSAKSKKGKTTRYNINLARRKGVEVSEREDFELAFDTLFGWMEDLEEAKEGFTNRRPREYLHEMMRRTRAAGSGHLFFASHEGTPLSGAFVLTFGKKLWFMHGASGKEKRKLQGNYLLQWEVIRWAKQRGVTHCDFGGAPKPEDRREGDPYYGVYRFKLGFGGDVVEYLGCMDLPVRQRPAAAWHDLEPFYYRAYYKLKGDVFY
jgi:lipid II:glycine glycyltransferase (peptidoglycan interpeptide bridge formation enzyme)